MRQTHFFAEYVHGLNSQSSGLGSVMRLFVATRVLRVPTLRTQSGPLLGSLLPGPGSLSPRHESSQLPPVLGAPRPTPAPRALPPPTPGLQGTRSHEPVRNVPSSGFMLMSPRSGRGCDRGWTAPGTGRGSPRGAGTGLERGKRYLFYELIFRTT